MLDKTDFDPSLRNIGVNKYRRYQSIDRVLPPNTLEGQLWKTLNILYTLTEQEEHMKAVRERIELAQLLALTKSKYYDVALQEKRKDLERNQQRINRAERIVQRLWGVNPQNFEWLDTKDIFPIQSANSDALPKVATPKARLSPIQAYKGSTIPPTFVDKTLRSTNLIIQEWTAPPVAQPPTKGRRPLNDQNKIIAVAEDMGYEIIPPRSPISKAAVDSLYADELKRAGETRIFATEIPRAPHQFSEAVRPARRINLLRHTASALPLDIEDPKNPVARKIIDWSIKNAPAFLVGAAAGTTVRIGAQFALAAMITTLPAVGAAAAAYPVVATILSAAAVGAVAGGVTKVVTTLLFGGEKKLEENWARKAFISGAKFGAVGGIIGAGIVDLMKPDGFFHTIFSHKNHNLASVKTHDVVTPPPAAQPSPPSSSAWGPAAAPAASTSGVKDLLSIEQLKHLSPMLQRLANSNNPHELIHFCKDASRTLMSGAHHDAASLKVGAELLQRGLDIAQKSDIHGLIVKKLHADLSYAQAWQVGTPKDLSSAIDHARQAGGAINSYGNRLLKFFRAPTNG